MIALWAGLAVALWDDGAGVAANAVGAFIVALIAYLPMMLCAGALWRLAECALLWRLYRRR